MQINLPCNLERFLNQLVESGEYHSADEVVRDGLLLLQERVRVRETRREQLRKGIAIGIEQADRGELLDGEEVFRDLLTRLGGDPEQGR